jgi:hypothetical protein
VAPPSTTLSPATGTPDGDQAPARFQFPLFGFEVLAVPFQVLVVISPASLEMRAIVVELRSLLVANYLARLK